MLSNDQCPHDVATLLKEFMRDLPDPLLCRDLYNAFVQTQSELTDSLAQRAACNLIYEFVTLDRDS